MTERQRDTEREQTDRKKRDSEACDRKTERQRDRETERQRDRRNFNQ